MRWSLVALMVAVIAAVSHAPAIAQDRGVMLDLRSAADPNAPVSERVELYRNSYALVIGNDAYDNGWPRLSNAVADAEEIAGLLGEQGFDVTLKTNLDSVELRTTLQEFFVIQGKDPDARLLFWFAGHGHSVDDEGFLVPVDAPAPSAPEFALLALHMRNFGSYMRLVKAKHVLAIFDSCFSGTIFTTRAGAAPPAVTRATTMPTRQFLTSGDAGQTVSDDGTFRKLFLSALRGETTADANGDGYLTASEVGLFMADEVTNYTEQSQTPRYGKLRDPDFARGDFVFVLPGRSAVGGSKAAVAGQTAAVDIESLMAEMVLWTSVVTSEDPVVVRTYLDQYPEGKFADPAAARVEELEARIAAEAAVAASAGAQAYGATEAPAEAEVAPEDATPAPVETAQDPEPAEPAKRLQGGINLTTVEDTADTSWLPNVTGGLADVFQLSELRQLREGSIGFGQPVDTMSKADKAVFADMGPQGYTVAPEAWQFSDPQGDSQYKIDGNWVHLRAPANHNMWNCDRGLAPILSVPVPQTDSWSVQTWFQLPARIGSSHTGLVVWNGTDSGAPTRALYFGPSGTRKLEAAGSYRADCTAGAGDISGQAGSRGRFGLEYAGGRGWLRISKRGDRLTFHFKSPFMHNWREVGSMMTEGKDGLMHVGLMAKTWGNEPLVASFSDLRIVPGHTAEAPWKPAYFDRLAQQGVASFSGADFEDFEWSDPNGDSLHEIEGDRIRIKSSGGRDIWNCDRGGAPILSVDVPEGDRWAAEVDFDLPARIGSSLTGLVLWNDEFEDAPVRALYFGPTGTTALQVSGSNAVDCTSGSNDLRNQQGSTGSFKIDYSRGKGRLRIARDGDLVSFYFKAPERRNWELVGSTLATARDDFRKIGLVGKTWGSEPLNAVFENFRLIADQTEPDQWVPSYFATLKNGEPKTFQDDAFSDFEWSDPNGNSVHEIRGNRIRMETTGGHSGVWNCDRNTAPMLTVPVPPRDSWVAQVRYQIPERAGETSAGLVLWNGAEHGAVRQISFGPGGTKGLRVAGAYSDDCTASANEIAGDEGNSGTFQLDTGGDAGVLQISKSGWLYKFSYFDPDTRQWTRLGTMEATVKDDFRRIGLGVSSWGSNPIAVEFSDFTLVPGVFN
ncbi:caspase family protein [Phaeobacter marinintestinus]|uniref:caspase family protein n=1 Tax=Falsiphaeobacter marinintestinus TaxID=1492905 RepID=UPI0011B7424A|nr:caspase family protein [Phaeobacter marinintestinus]